MNNLSGKVSLRWKRFSDLRSAQNAFRNVPCIYVLTDKDGLVLKIGESRDLWNRYRGGTGKTLKAALHESGKLIFVAVTPVDDSARKKIEANLTFIHKPLYCVQNKDFLQIEHLKIEHLGDVPTALS